MKGRLHAAAFMNDFLCNLKGRVIISFGMLLVCLGNDCPTAPRLFAQHYSRAWKPAIHHHPYSAQQRLLTRKTPLLKKQSDYPQLVVRVWKMYHKEPWFNSQDGLFGTTSHQSLHIFLTREEMCLSNSQSWIIIAIKNWTVAAHIKLVTTAQIPHLTIRVVDLRDDFWVWAISECETANSASYRPTWTF